MNVTQRSVLLAFAIVAVAFCFPATMGAWYGWPGFIAAETAVLVGVLVYLSPKDGEGPR